MDIERAKWLGLYYLGIKARTEYELRKKLKDKGAEDEICDLTIDFLKEYNYINDEEFARSYALDAYNLKRCGVKRIRAELRQKGVDEHLTESVLEELGLDFELKLAEIIEARAERLDLTDRKQKQRLVGYLARRGYGMSEIINGINAYMNSESVFADDYD